MCVSGRLGHPNAERTDKLRSTSQLASSQLSDANCTMRHLKPSILLTSILSATGIVASEDPNDVSILIREAGRANNDSLLWGPYKSNLYFGVRPRIPKSLAAGLIWGKVDDYAGAQQSISPAQTLA